MSNCRPLLLINLSGYWPRPLIRQSKRKITQLWSGPWRMKQFHNRLVVVIRQKTGKHQTVHVDILAPSQTPTPSITPAHTDTPFNTAHSSHTYSAHTEQTTTTHKPQTFDTPPSSQDNQDSEAQDPYSQYTPSTRSLQQHTPHLNYVVLLENALHRRTFLLMCKLIS